MQEMDHERMLEHQEKDNQKEKASNEVIQPRSKKAEPNRNADGVPNEMSEAPKPRILISL